MLGWLQVIILAAVLGLAGVLPVSDSGFLSAARKLLGLPLDGSGDGLYVSLLYLVIALVICLMSRRELFGVTSSKTRGRKRKTAPSRTQSAIGKRLLPLLFIGAIPAVPFLIFRSKLLPLSGNLAVVAVIMGLMGLLVFSCDRVGYGKRTLAETTIVDGLLIGLFEGLGMIPGLSPVGLGIVMGIWRGLNPVFSVKYACLACVPMLLIQGIMGIVSCWGEPFRIVYLLGLVICGLLTGLAVRFMRYVARRGSIGEFSLVLWGGALFMFVLSLVS